MTATHKKLLLSLILSALPASAARGQSVLFHDAFAAPNGSFASPDWLVRAGALRAVGQAAWTGSPAPLRLLTQRDDVGDAAVSLQLYNQGFGTSAATAHDGVHVWLRHKDDETLYAVSVSRRDDTVRIQKKSGGRYHDLAPAAPLKARYGRWQRVTVAARDTEDGTVTIQAFVAGRLVASAVDDGVGGPALRGPGRVGLRADNCQFLFDDFTVTALTGSDAP
jgi:hypothetical protein